MKKNTLKIRTRLVVAFLIVTCTPLFLISIGSAIYANYQINAIEDYYNVDSDGWTILSDSTRLLNRLTQEIYKEIIMLAQNEPERFEDKARLDSMNERLKDKYSFMVVVKSGDVIYDGSEGGAGEIYGILKEFFNVNTSHESGYYIEGKYLVKQDDFCFADEAQGSVFIVTRLERMMPEVKSFLYGLAAVIVIGMILTAVVMTTWIYRSIFAPLKQLQKATHEIKEGNLNYSLKDIGNDEIGELCRDFEEMRERLRQSTEEKLQYDMDNKELISNISHDLKTPITAIKGYVEGLMDGVADTPEKIDRYVRTIYNKAMDMDRLIEELTFYSKIDANRIPYTFDKVNVDRYFSDCTEELALDLEEKQIDIRYKNDADKSIIIIADAEQLKKVVNNIVGNSVKYIGDKRGLIQIHITDAGDFVQIEMSDNGKGIAQKDLPYIFDRFYRTDTSRNSSQGGSGIGLSIVRKIVEDHGGKIWATSKENEGTTMIMVFRKYQEVSV